MALLKGFKLTSEHLTYGAIIAVAGFGAWYLYTNPDILNKMMGKPTQAEQLAAQQPPIDQNLEMEEAEAKGMLPPFGPSGVGGAQIQTPFAVGGSGNVNGSIGGPKNYPGIGIGGPGLGFEGAQVRRCMFRPADLVEATLQTARQYIRVLDFPVTPITNTIPRLESCYYREIANFVNAGPTNPVYFAVEQVACAITSGAPFPVLNSKSLMAAQIAKKHVNQGNCYNETMIPVAKRFDPVPVYGVKRAAAIKAYRARKRAMAARRAAAYNYYARGFD